MTKIDLEKIQFFFFIGIAGTGMSAIAQYLAEIGKSVSGSDRLFESNIGSSVKKQLEAKGIRCFPQNGSGINSEIELVVVSTAIESTIPEYQKSVSKNIPICMRSDLLAAIGRTKKTIAVAGTSGKSTVAAMIFRILEFADFNPSLITGAGLISLPEKGEIGNAKAGKGEFLIIEADESDGSIVKYHPEIGILLNIDKDHKEIAELHEIFSIFKKNTIGKFIVNQSNERSRLFSENREFDFGENAEIGFCFSDFRQKDFKISFKIRNIEFELNQIGRHNAENAAAAVAAAFQCGVSPEKSAAALKTYSGIYRRHQIIGHHAGITVIDDYAHNPAKLAASIRASQLPEHNLKCWFQPHGYKPTRFLRNDFTEEIAKSLRENDEIWMSEIYYAGGSAVKDISAADLIKDLKNKGIKAFFVENRENLVTEIIQNIKGKTIVLLNGARDPSLAEFAHQFFENLSNKLLIDN
jgi:UDP-N-acetylmuramate--alanine ligase